MDVSIISFTKRGAELSLRIKKQHEIRGNQTVRLYTKHKGLNSLPYIEEGLSDWVRKQWEQRNAILFVGACGIAVRAISPVLRDKLSDCPILVADEAGDYVIPILAGHYGGANELAACIAKEIHATPVITTATDVNHLFAVDVFAKKNALLIENRTQIAAVSSKILETGHIVMELEGKKQGVVPKSVIMRKAKEQIQQKPPDVVVGIHRQFDSNALHLIPRVLVLGMGCKKGKTSREIEEFVTEQLMQLFLSMKAIAAIASIDVKREETGFCEFAKCHQIPFKTYSKEELMQLPGTFTKSQFVETQVGVDNVCERAAMLACNKTGTMLLKKTAKNGMTLAIAMQEWSVTFDET